MEKQPPQPAFNGPDFRSMSLYILNIIIPLVFVYLLICVLSVSENRVGFLWPILMLFGTNMTVTSLQNRERFRTSTWLTILRFCISFSILCRMAVLSRETGFEWVFFLPQCFAISFSFLMPRRAFALFTAATQMALFAYWDTKPFAFEGKRGVSLSTGVMPDGSGIGLLAMAVYSF